jgi:hypothetical protein
MAKTTVDRRTFNQLLAMGLVATATPALPAWAHLDSARGGQAK